MAGLVGKTVAAVEVQQWAGRDTFKDDVTWQRTVITFTDETTLQYDTTDSEVYDEYRAVLDDDGHPHRYVKEVTACRYCGHGIGLDPEEGWVAPDAGFDVEGGDGMWRTICPDREDDGPNPEHDPENPFAAVTKETLEEVIRIVVDDPGVICGGCGITLHTTLTICPICGHRTEA